jgi:lysozyme
MKTSINGLNIIKEFEGLKLEAYKCPANVWTIGYGHTGGVKETDKITIEDAERLLKKDLELFEYKLNSLKLELNQNQFDALISFIYNIGFSAFNKSTMLTCLKKGKFKEAGIQFSRWIYAANRVLTGLVRRREEESRLFNKEV